MNKYHSSKCYFDNNEIFKLLFEWKSSYNLHFSFLKAYIAIIVAFLLFVAILLNYFV